MCETSIVAGTGGLSVREALDVACDLVLGAWAGRDDQSAVQLRAHLTRLARNVLEGGTVPTRSQAELLLAMATDRLTDPSVNDLVGETHAQLLFAERSCEVLVAIEAADMRDVVVEAERVRSQLAAQRGGDDHIEIARHAVELSERWFPGSVAHALALATFAFRVSGNDPTAAATTASAALDVLGASGGEASRDVAECLRLAASSFLMAKMYPEADRTVVRSLEVLEQLGLTRTRRHVRALTQLAEARVRTLGAPAALAQYEQASELLAEALPDDRSVELAYLLNNHAWLLTQCGRAHEALPMIEVAVDIALELFGRTHPTTAIRFSNLSAVLVAVGDPERGLQVARDALAISRELDLPSTGIRLNRVSDALLALGRYDEALATAEEALALLTSRWPKRSRGRLLLSRATVRLARAEPVPAVDDLSAAISAVRRDDPLLTPNLYLRRAEAFAALGQREPSRRDAETALEHFATTFGDHPAMADCKRLLGS